MYKNEMIENSIEFSTQTPKRQMSLSITTVSTIVILGLSIGVWNLITGGIGFYPNVTLFKGKPCGGYHFSSRPMLKLQFAHCFTTYDTETQVDKWYRAKGWYRFGETSLYPSVNLGIVSIAVNKSFLTEKQKDGTMLLVQNVQYFAGHP